MSKIPKISGNLMIRYLIRKEFVIISRTGSHVVLKKNQTYTSVPAGNKTMKIGLQLGILRDVMISREEFIDDYKNKIIK